MQPPFVGERPFNGMRIDPQAVEPVTDILASALPRIVETCRRYPVSRLEVFGSAADGGGFAPGSSDVDFLVEFQEGADLGPWLTVYFNLQSELEEICGTRVDLVMASAPKNPYFMRELNRTRRTVYAA